MPVPEKVRSRRKLSYVVRCKILCRQLLYDNKHIPGVKVGELWCMFRNYIPVLVKI